MFHNTTSDLQDEDHSVQDQDQDRFFLLSDRSCPKTDGLRPHHCFLLYKTCYVELGQVTAKLVNFFLSLTQREAPVTRKTANIIPVSKTSLVSGPYVLRPISVTPILSRTVEKLVAKNYLTPSCP